MEHRLCSVWPRPTKRVPVALFGGFETNWKERKVDEEEIFKAKENKSNE